MGGREELSVQRVKYCHMPTGLEYWHDIEQTMDYDIAIEDCH